VVGVLPPRADAARAALRLALEMHAAAAAVDAGAGRRVQLRVGVTVGRVAAGCVGHLRPRFDLHGEAVDAAAAMAAAARAGCVVLPEEALAAAGLPACAAERVSLDLDGGAAAALCCLEAGSAAAIAARDMLDAVADDGQAGASPGAAAAAVVVVDDDPDEGGAVEEPAPPVDALPLRPSMSRPRSSCYSPVRVSRASALSTSRAGSAFDPFFSGFPGDPACAGAAAGLPATPGEGSVRGSFMAAIASEAESEARLQAGIEVNFVQHVLLATLPGYLYLGLAPRAGLLGFGARAAAAAYLALAAAFFARRALPASARAPLLRLAVRGAVWCRVALSLLSSAALMQDARADVAPEDVVPQLHRYFWRIHVPWSLMSWTTARLPVAIAFFPELLRNALFCASACAAAAGAGALDAATAAAFAAEAACCAAVVPILLVLTYRTPESVMRLLADVGPARARCTARATRCAPQGLRCASAGCTTRRCWTCRPWWCSPCTPQRSCRASCSRREAKA